MGMASRPQPPEVIASRRIINANFEALILALAGNLDPEKQSGGLLAIAKEDSKKRLTELLEATRTAADEVNNKNYDSRMKYLQMLEKQAESLSQWIALHKPEEPEADAEGEAEDKAADPAAPNQPDVASN